MVSKCIKNTPVGGNWYNNHIQSPEKLYTLAVKGTDIRGGGAEQGANLMSEVTVLNGAEQGANLVGMQEQSDPNSNCVTL